MDQEISWQHGSHERMSWWCRLEVTLHTLTWKSIVTTLEAHLAPRLHAADAAISLPTAPLPAAWRAATSSASLPKSEEDCHASRLSPRMISFFMMPCLGKQLSDGLDEVRTADVMRRPIDSRRQREEQRSASQLALSPPRMSVTPMRISEGRRSRGESMLIRSRIIIRIIPVYQWYTNGMISIVSEVLHEQHPSFSASVDAHTPTKPGFDTLVPRSQGLGQGRGSSPWCRLNPYRV